MEKLEFIVLDLCRSNNLKLNSIEGIRAMGSLCKKRKKENRKCK